MVYRLFVEKKPEFANEASALLSELRGLLGIRSLESLRIINRYDVENIAPELFEYAKKTVFSEPQLDNISETLDSNGISFAVEYLPGQYDQRADSAAQCIQIISQGERPTVRTAKVYILGGNVRDAELEAIKKYVINPVEAREASSAKPDTLAVKYDIPETVETLDGFTGLDRAGLESFVKENGLAMDVDDLQLCRDYFKSVGREPTVTEIKVIDTYWSDHCRHTTFLTEIDDVKFEDKLLQSAYEEYLDTRRALNRTKPVCLMDIATLAVKSLRASGELDRLDESEEVNACTVKIDVSVDGVTEPWLLLFKNETHNHPTEIEPFGGAATCIGGAIRDPLSGRAYVYGAMRVTGAADPLTPIAETISGKLPQRKIVTTAAAGYASYGNQIGLATGIVDELYHPGYAAKRMEIGAVIAAAPAENVRRERPEAGDVVILLGGSTGRDGCGGATGSSKAHTVESLESCGAEVQKGNAPEERKLQRLFRNPEACRLIRRCNDFGAGGVSVAIGELAAGLDIDLNAVPKKYEGLDGTELAISESQERMAVVVEAADCKRFLELAAQENLQAVPVADVKAEPCLKMKWNGKYIVDISRAFLDSNGAPKHINAITGKAELLKKSVSGGFAENLLKTAEDLNCCSKRGLSERFDSTIGAGTVLMPFGGKYQLTPIQAMVQKISVEKKHTDDCSLMSWGYNPFITEKSPYHGAYLAVIESVSKLVSTGAEFKDVYLTFQEYFERLGKDPARWGKPLSALLGAFKAQMQLRIGAVGGKDSMSGSFESLDVPPTLVSFAVTTGKTSDVLPNHFRAPGHNVVLLAPEYDETGLPVPESLLANFDRVTQMIRSGEALAVYTPGYGGAAEAVLKMCLGNGVGFCYDSAVPLEAIFGYRYGAFVVELAGEPSCGMPLGRTTADAAIAQGDERLPLAALQHIYEDKLEPVYPCNIRQGGEAIPLFRYETAQRTAPAVQCAKPRVLIPVFPGTNCEYDTARAFERAGIAADVLVLRNLTANDVAEAAAEFARRAQQGQIIFIPGGFSGGDEPDGSGKLITAFFRNPRIRESVDELLKNRDGLMCGVCNGFQTLIKLGLIPYGEIRDADAQSPTLTYNVIGRHQSKIVRTRVCSNKSPWLMRTVPDEIYSVPVSHGEGRILCSEAQLQALAENGQIATQYVDPLGQPTLQVQFNPNGSAWAVEGLTSPDGRVLGKMGHSERIGAGLYKNVEGRYDMQIFASAADYFKIR